MAVNDDLWDHLRDSGIEPCSENDDIEIDEHDMRSLFDISHSYYFDCLKFSNGISFSMVSVIVSNGGEISVDPNRIIFDITPGMDTQTRLQELIDQLTASLQTFIQNRGELI